MKEISIKDVSLNDPFWSPRQKLITDVTIPYMEKILRDEIEGAEKSHAIRNFRIAAGLEDGEFYGMVFQDSDVYKWLEAASYALYLKPDRELEKRFDETVELVAMAQQDDGYLNTWFTVKQPGKRWTNLLECHELYCAGHLFEAAAAAFEALGKTSLLAVSERFAEHIIAQFMDNDAIPGHEEIEIGFLRLYHVTGKKQYLQMALRFLNSRGNNPAWFAENTPEGDGGSPFGGYGLDPKNNIYNQSDMPIREQTTSRGHAVRMMYLMTAMADAAVSTGDTELYEVCERVLKNTAERKMAVTGGLGARAEGESFGDDFELPNDTCYNETCASVAAVFFLQKLLLGRAKGEYADLMERELYNGALSGMQLDGKRFFYVNPLEADPKRSGILPELKHSLIERPQWYSCACCPPNLARLITSLGKYIFGEDDECIYAHLYIGCEAELEHARITLDSNFPWQCSGEFTICPKTDTEFSLAICIPAYAEKAELSVNQKGGDYTVRDGYAYIKRHWTAGDKVRFSFAGEPRLIASDERVKNTAGCAALAMGPLIYCFEQIDNSTALCDMTLQKSEQPIRGEYAPELLNGIVPLSIGEHHAVPYYAWSNRGANAMRVWVPVE